MAVPRGLWFPMDFDLMFAQGAAILGEVEPVHEYQSEADRLRNRPPKQKTDEDGVLLWKCPAADPSAEKEREKSITVEIVSTVRPVPPEALPGFPLRPVIFEGLRVQPRAEASPNGAKWITWNVRATGMRSAMAAGGAAKAPRSSQAEASAKPAGGKAA